MSDAVGCGEYSQAPPASHHGLARHAQCFSLVENHNEFDAPAGHNARGRVLEQHLDLKGSQPGMDGWNLGGDDHLADIDAGCPGPDDGRAFLDPGVVSLRQIGDQFDDTQVIDAQNRRARPGHLTGLEHSFADLSVDGRQDQRIGQILLSDGEAALGLVLLGPGQFQPGLGFGQTCPHLH